MLSAADQCYYTGWAKKWHPF